MIARPLRISLSLLDCGVLPLQIISVHIGDYDWLPVLSLFVGPFYLAPVKVSHFQKYFVGRSLHLVTLSPPSKVLASGTSSSVASSFVILV